MKLMVAAGWCAVLLLAGGALGAASSEEPPRPKIRISLDPKPVPKEAAPKDASKKAPADAAERKEKTTPAPGRKEGGAERPVEEIRIEGLEIARSSAGFLGLRIVDGVFRLSFYDAQRQPVPADAARVVLRWNTNYKPGTEFYVLEPAEDGKTLFSPRTVRPPYRFKIFISVFGRNNEVPSETYTVDFEQ